MERASRMAGLLRAEWHKVVKNHVLTGFLVWIFPIGAAAFFAIATVMGLISENAQRAMLATSSGQWTTDVTAVWTFVTSFPANTLGRMLPLAFMAVVFAGEYQWGAWKNLVPRSRRAFLILAKFATLTTVVMLALSITSAVVGIGQWLTHQVAAVSYGPPLTAQVAADFLRHYTRESLLGMTSLLVLAGFAALGALITRSILGALLIGFGLSLFEALSPVLLAILGRVLDESALVNLYRFTSAYSIDNVRSWLVNDTALTRIQPGFTAEPSLAFSLMTLAVWVIGLVTLALMLFERQDITS